MPDKRTDAQSTTPAIPSVAIPDHNLIRLIAKGSYGEVWLAKNTLGTYRAVKVVFAATFRDHKPFEREFSGVQKFEPVSRLHPGLMDVLQVGRNPKEGFFYCVMELADDANTGQNFEPETYQPHTLSWEISKHKLLPIKNCIEIGFAIASALAFLHEKGLIHRDVKPSNIIFIEGAPKLADIGLVAEMSEALSYVGTEGFIPPEGPGTIQADIYSLGKVLYEISTGKDRHEYPELPTLLGDSEESRKLIEFNKIVIKACRTKPKDRYASSLDLSIQLRRLEEGKAIVDNKSKWSLIFVVLLLIALAGIYYRTITSRRSLQIRNANNFSTVAYKKPTPVPKGIVAWWPGDGITKDLISGQWSLLMQEAGFSEGKVGKAFTLDGLSAHVRIPDRADLRLTNGMTIEAWIFPTRTETWIHPFDTQPWEKPGRRDVFQEIVSKWDIRNTGQKSYTLTLRPEGKISLTVSATGTDSGATTIISTNIVPLAKWTHVAATYDSQFLRIFINGAVESEVSYHEGIFPGTNDLALGGFVGGAAPGEVLSPFKGQVDEVSIYNRALTPAELALIHRADSAGKKK